MKKLTVKSIALFFLGFSLLGLVDASYLTYEHYANKFVPCNIGGCEQVLSSEYSEIYGIPTALLGVGYYLTIITIILVYRKTKNVSILKYLSYFTAIGFIVSVFLVYLQFAIIKSICPYCMFSAFTSTTLFIIGIYYLYSLSEVK